MIKSDGSIKPCCTSFGDQLKGFGNIHDKELKSIWDSKSLIKFQEMHKNYKWHQNEVCKKCINSIEFFE